MLFCVRCWDSAPFSPSRIKLQPSLDKTWHLDKKEQEIAQLFQDSMAIIAQIRGPSVSHDALKGVPGSPRGPMFYLLALCRCPAHWNHILGPRQEGRRGEKQVHGEKPDNIEVTDWDVAAAQITTSTS